MLDEKLEMLKEKFRSADAVVIGAGCGLSASAGYAYSGARFQKYFWDFKEKYGFHDMYSGGFFPYGTLEDFWGFWCRYIWINRYAPIPSRLYGELLCLVKSKDYFVITTNVDHCFQRAGFDKERLFYTQGDYGLFQSSSPGGKSAGKTYDNAGEIRDMVLQEGFEIADDGELLVPENTRIKMKILPRQIPVCRDDGKPMTVNLRSDGTFVEDAGWHLSQGRYADFLAAHKRSGVLFLELGVGLNTPGVIKYPFWRMTLENKRAFYVSVGLSPVACPPQIESRSLILNEDVGKVVRALSEGGR